MHDPRVGRFFAVDPLEKKYPWYTPYQFSGNRVVDMVELEGLEPDEPDQAKYKYKTFAIDGPYVLTGGDELYQQNKELLDVENRVSNTDESIFFGNNRNDPMQRYVNTDNIYIMSNTTENKIKDENAMVNILLGNFIWGEGPENIVFPKNGKFSGLMKNSIAVGESLIKWDRKGQSDGIFAWSMGARNEINTDIKSGFLSLEHFMGSVSVRIGKVDSDNILVEIFNVTSFTSGNLTKDIPFVNWFVDSPMSTVREPYDVYPYLTEQRTYSNTSQYFSFTMNKKEYTNKIRQYGYGAKK
ncbi:hypothetical protein HUK80_17565 [Flavobacterium sp. MAH-1]|uniref:RHS repeat-associated core domain-containing protein n=1 Tax=Flavobacterium agri TaxID=2743471 RepID=A0A7Y9C8T6_9FLAO|nr:hypothetical protein [Flavobacterium agri]NYA72738.1 hypothetical protein [Flavobacterium agri]